MFPNAMRTISDFQAFHRWLDEQKGWGPDLKLNMVLLAGEVGEVANELRNIFWRQSLLEPELGEAAAWEAALAEYRQDLGFELADCLAYIFKLANNAGIDLEAAYKTKMAKNVQRQWTAPPPANHNANQK